jgi:transglutaminase-like putative cysteine protease
VTLSPRIQQIARQITEGKESTFEKAHAIYDYVFENVSYDKTLPGWGQGDTERVCLVKAGNCTDFHSLFISLARASGIPAKFVMGTSLPKQKQGEIGGYHCWAEFYDEQRGWIPLDISEAWKDKAKRDYYFGTVGEDRLEFTNGRDIILEPPQKGEPLNYFVYPYAEADGVPHKNISVIFKFKEQPEKGGGMVSSRPDVSSLQNTNL